MRLQFGPATSPARWMSVSWQCYLLSSGSIKQQAKLVWSLLLVVVFFIITTVLVPVNSDSWQTTFFAITMVMVVILNGGCRHYGVGYVEEPYGMFFVEVVEKKIIW